ncbi:MAG: hypothetical protein HQK83_18085 [Fibrobacteria bacterium]|nr:hypothetical protein [Fibrobacteria bacterium]
MKLPVHKIPTEFAESVPRGMRLISKGHHDFLLIESLFCANGHSLMDNSVRIHGEASIKLKIKSKKEEGVVFIDAFWGSYSKLFSYIPTVAKKNQLIDVLCPHCESLLIENGECTQKGCKSGKKIVLHLPGGNNRIHVCAKLGCPGHLLKISDMPDEITESVSDLNFFGAAGDDELFQGI